MKVLRDSDAAAVVAGDSPAATLAINIRNDDEVRRTFGPILRYLFPTDYRQLPIAVVRFPRSKMYPLLSFFIPSCVEGVADGRRFVSKLKTRTAKERLSRVDRKDVRTQGLRFAPLCSVALMESWSSTALMHGLLWSCEHDTASALKLRNLIACCFGNRSVQIQRKLVRKI